MFSRILGKGEKSVSPPEQGGSESSGLEVVEDDPETGWGLWDSALADLDSKFSPLSSTQALAPASSAQADEPTEPMKLEDRSPAQRREGALLVVEQHHQRVANTIRALWGYKECSMYINKLIMNGDDGMGHARIGFNQDAVEAMMLLSDLHEAQFGAPDTADNLGFADPSVRAGLDGAR